MRKDDFAYLVNKRNKAFREGDVYTFFCLSVETGYTPRTPYEIDAFTMGELEESLKKEENKKLLSEARRLSSAFKKVPRRDFYMPRHAYEFSDIIKRHWENQGTHLPKGFGKYPKERLKAIYLSLIDRGEL